VVEEQGERVRGLSSVGEASVEQRSQERSEEQPAAHVEEAERVEDGQAAGDKSLEQRQDCAQQEGRQWKPSMESQ
jgi:hypothetical protein